MFLMLFIFKCFFYEELILVTQTCLIINLSIDKENLQKVN